MQRNEASDNQREVSLIPSTLFCSLTGLESSVPMQIPRAGSVASAQKYHERALITKMSEQRGKSGLGILIISASVRDAYKGTKKVHNLERNKTNGPFRKCQILQLAYFWQTHACVLSSLLVEK